MIDRPLLPEQCVASRHDGPLALSSIYENTIDELLADVTGKRVLDAGCGDGLYAQKLAERGAQCDTVLANMVLMDIPRFLVVSLKVEELDFWGPTLHFHRPLAYSSGGGRGFTLTMLLYPHNLST